VAFLVINPDCPLGSQPIVGASLLAKMTEKFASKLAPTLRVISNGLSGIKTTHHTACIILSSCLWYLSVHSSLMPH
jgi:hypothetical protein